MPPKHPLHLFISYAHDDEELRRELELHLAVLRREGRVVAWHDRLIQGGSEWRGEIDQQLQQADLVLLLVSPHFVASNYCYEVELEQALSRHQAGTARVVPIIIRPTEGWQRLPFGALEALPSGGTPVASRGARDQAWADVVAGIRRIVDAWPSATLAVPEDLEPPGGGYATRWYIQRHVAERDALLRLGVPALPAVLRGPKHFGKSLMMQHLLSELQRPESPSRPSPYRVVAIDLRLLDATAWASADAFFKAIAFQLATPLGCDEGVVRKLWSSKLSPSLRLRRLLEEKLLPALAAEERLVLAIDHADEVCERTPEESRLPDDFFGLLRNLCEEARQPGHLFAKLRLLVAIGHSPAFLLRSEDRSLFYFADDIHLQDLDRTEVLELAARYRLAAPPEALDALSGWVGGHPYLVRLVFYRAALARRPLLELLSEPGRETVFDDYLRHTRGRLERAGLYRTAREVYQNPRASLDARTYDCLERAGIMLRAEENGAAHYRLRYPVYRGVFRL